MREPGPARGSWPLHQVPSSTIKGLDHDLVVLLRTTLEVRFIGGIVQITHARSRLIKLAEQILIPTEYGDLAYG
jgi:hypothetical protein